MTDQRDENVSMQKVENYSVGYLFNEFLGNTYTHGPSKIRASKSWLRKLFWTALFLGAFAFNLWQIWQLFNRHRDRPLSTHVTIQHEKSLAFPAITVCNVNALRKAEILKFPKELRSELQNRSNNETNASDHDVAEEDHSGEEGDPTPSDEEGDNEDFEDPDDLHSKSIGKRKLIALIARQKVTDLEPIGHQFEDFVILCTFRGVSCSNFTSRYWSRYWHYLYGNCFVFNGGQGMDGKEVPALKSNKPGPFQGLILELNIEEEQHIGLLSDEAGVKVDISNQGEMPFPEDKGVSIAPGYATSIGIRKVTINRQDPLSEDRCRKNSSLEEANLYKQRFKVGYSSAACRESCLAFNQRKRCNCMEQRFPVNEGTTPVCDVLNELTVKCLRTVQTDYRNNKLNCTTSCPPPCRENIFKLTTSFTKWPTAEHEGYYREELRKRNKEVDGSENFKNNVLKLKIFYEELNMEVISEELSYELVNFVSDIGGSLGLWIGMSILSFTEILELLALIGYSLITKWKKKRDGEIKPSTGTLRAFTE